ncbi:LLM class oxidoreductase [Neisseria dentiae]|uniref:LLM class oxidoreductase n=1 Tax=Neisseria dentiae TaxID=194197 RepID=UPI00359F8B51
METQLPNFSVLNQDNSKLFEQSPAAAPLSDGLKLPETLAQHAAFSRVFQAGKLTFGLIAPFKGYADSPFPELHDFAGLAQAAEQSGFAALWLRDVPFYDPNFGDTGQIYDPFVTAGYLAAQTRRIAIGTAGIVTPLREPLHVAKAAASIDALSDGRFLLGMSSGDRPVEYPAFAQNFDNRAERFREAWAIIDTATREPFPRRSSEHYGTLSGNIDMLPKPQSVLPKIAIGRARQDLAWLANTPDAWIWHGVDPQQVGKIINTINELGDGQTWKPFGYANFVDLAENPAEPVRLLHNIFLRGGAQRLAEHWQAQREQGLAHVTINLKPTRRPAKEVLQELSETVLPAFV